MTIKALGTLMAFNFALWLLIIVLVYTIVGLFS